MRLSIVALSVWWALGVAAAAAEEPDVLALTHCVEVALARSPGLAAADAVRAAADQKAHGLRAQGAPKFFLDGQVRRLSEVPILKPSPLAPAVEMGDNLNYSFGPQAQWQLWDSGVRRHAAAGLTALAAARAAEGEAAAKDVRWSVRRAYFQIMGAAERLRSVAEVLRLAQAQREDVRLRKDAGTASRQDWLQSEAEALGRLREFREAQAELGSALRALFLLTRDPAPDLLRPLPRDLSRHRPAEIPPPTFIFESESVATLREALEPATRRAFDAAAPDLRAGALSARAAREAAASVRSGRGPVVLLQARSSRDYPNGPVHEAVQQNTLGASARWSLFEGGRSVREAAEQDSLARAADARRAQTQDERQAAWAQARDRLAGLVEEEEVQTRLIDRRRDIAETIYDAYQAGRASYLEVETANTTLLNARVQGARLTVDILTHLAWLDRLSSPEAP